LIVYLDTSAVVPLLVTESASTFCRRLWDEADAVTTVRLTYVEAAAALAQAQRLDRLRPTQHQDALRLLDRLWMEFELVEIDDALVRRAAALADECALRGYDAVHCAAAEQLDDHDLVAAAGDRKLLEAWRDVGLATADTAQAD
jgi:predicted nucleic acid-binding protein